MIPSLSHFLVISRYAHDPSQEQSEGIIVLDDDDLEAIDELLKYLYKFSDHLNTSCVYRKLLQCYDPLFDDDDWGYTDEEVPELLLEHLEELSNEVKHFADVLIVADKYCVRDLATLASEKIKARLSMFRGWAPTLDSLPAAKSTCAFSEALHFEEEIPPLQKYQDLFLETITSKIDIGTAIFYVELIRTHPKLVRELLQHSTKAVKSEKERSQSIIAKLPKAKRKIYE